MARRDLADDYRRALGRARANRVFVAGEVFVPVPAAGERSWLVYSPHARGHYTVRTARGGRALSCNCEAGRRDIYCQHRAVVHAWLLAEREQGRR